MLNKALRLLRTYERLTQSQAALKLGFSQSYLSEIEKGSKTPTLEIVQRYADEFGIPLSTIMLFAENVDDQSSLSKARTLVAGKVIGLLEFLERNAGEVDA